MNETIDIVNYVIEICGVAAFAISGATEGFKNKLDMFGVCLLGVLTALGGGIMRDVCLGIFPPVAFTRYDYLAVCLLVSVITFFYSYIRVKVQNSQQTRDEILNIVDAFGLGLFVVAGVNASIGKFGFDKGYVAVCAALLTSIGGGIVRDVLVMKIPTVLYKHIYALAAISGAVLYFELEKRTDLNNYLTTAITVVFVVAVRLIATYGRLNLPKAKGTDE